MPSAQRVTVCLDEQKVGGVGPGDVPERARAAQRVAKRNVVAVPRVPGGLLLIAGEIVADQRKPLAFMGGRFERFPCPVAGNVQDEGKSTVTRGPAVLCEYCLLDLPGRTRGVEPAFPHRHDTGLRDCRVEPLTAPGSLQGVDSGNSPEHARPRGTATLVVGRGNREHGNARGGRRMQKLISLGGAVLGEMDMGIDPLQLHAPILAQPGRRALHGGSPAEGAAANIHP